MKSHRIRARAAKRNGFGVTMRDELDALARTNTMIRAGAYLVEEGIRKMWWGDCGRCLIPHWLSWCHCFTRAVYTTRWDPDNAFAWCSGCHRWLDQHWPEKQDWVIRKIGQERFDRLMLRSRTPVKVDMSAQKFALLHDHAQLLKGGS